jgi:hypothetical protein
MHIAAISPLQGTSNRDGKTRIRVVPSYNIIACRTVAMQPPRDGRIYHGRFWATAQ